MDVLQPGLFLHPEHLDTIAQAEAILREHHTRLNIDTANALELPANAFIGQRIAVLGSSGFGKSNTIAVLFEELADQLPITIIDPHGEYYGLTEKFDILHVGKGEFVDIEAGVDQAESIAKFAFENRVHVIVNMLEMGDDERLEFTYLYCKTLWDLNKRVKRPIGVILDEAHIFVPESKANIPSLKLMMQFALEGRKFGFTVMVSDQRVALISKTVLGQCGMAFLHGVDIYVDMQAYQGMLPYSLAETKKIAYGLKRGQAIVKWTFEGNRSVDVVQIRKRYTFHASDTPTASDANVPELRRLDSDMIAELKAAMTPIAKPVVAIAATTESPAAVEAYKQTLIVLEAKYEHQHKIHRAGLGLLLVAYGATMKRLKAQINSRPLPDESGKNETPDTVLETSESPVIVDADGYRSPLALTRAINKQKRDFEKLLDELRLMPRFHQLMLAYLTQYEGQELELKQIARFIGIAENTIQRTPPTRLLDRHLLYRRFHRGGPHYYRSTVRVFMQTTFPDLNPDALVEAITRLQRLT